MCCDFSLFVPAPETTTHRSNRRPTLLLLFNVLFLDFTTACFNSTYEIDFFLLVTQILTSLHSKVKQMSCGRSITLNHNLEMLFLFVIVKANNWAEANSPCVASACIKWGMR